MELHWDILDKKRKEILPLLKRFSDDGFYLARGTGLALQLGHRDSIDFDFFKQGHFDTSKFVQQLESEYLKIASIKDIACMKIAAITSRATEKDYVDLYFILSNFTLKDILESCRKKFKSLDEFVILKSLTFFEDVEPEHILFKEGHHVSLKQLQEFFENTTNEYIRGEQLKSIQQRRRDKDIER